jgi:hypothetical protein
MRFFSRWQLLGLCLGVTLFALMQGSAQGVVVVFKDGFIIQGRVTTPTGVIVDKVSGQAFTVPAGGGVYFIDDDVRRIIFSPSQVHDVLPDPTGFGDVMKLKRFPPTNPGSRMPMVWLPEREEPWDNKWERTVKVSTPQGPVEMVQRLTVLSPKRVRVDALKYDWMPHYLPAELGPKNVRVLVHNYLQQKTKQPESKRHVLVARFLFQAGWTDLARKELEGLEGFTSEQEEAAQLVKDISKVQARELAEAIQTAFKAGQYKRTEEMIGRFLKEDMGGSVGDKLAQRVQETKTKLEAGQERLTQVRRLLKDLPGRAPRPRQEQLTAAVDVIQKELSLDSLPRLETFLNEARTWELAWKQGRTPDRTAEQLLAFALTGWLLGSEAAESRIETAWDLWQARELVLKYQRTDDPAARRQLLAAQSARGKLGPDMVARIIRNMPPPDSYAKPGTEPIALAARPAGGGKGCAYQVQLPPEYSHARAYPVLIVLHRSDEKPGDLLEKWSELAGRHGFIVAAPEWGRSGTYGYSSREHDAVLDCLRDLRLRFQVDSDRVFLFGAEEGGQMAYDVGLAHPDQFAGVLPMAAGPHYFSARYGPNAQYLPFYVVDGEKDAYNAKANRDQFKDWVRRGFPAILVEYKGRSKDWFGAELANMMDWMSRKKRTFPVAEVGRDQRSQEFQTLRSTDNRFYWLSAGAVSQRHLNDFSAWNAGTPPATLQARVSPGNHIYVRTSGVQKVSVWLTSGMINFGQKVTLHHNSSPVGAPVRVVPSLAILLEDFYERADRQQLFVARLDMKQ